MDADFSDWIEAQDVDGRMGWEAPGLEHQQRWWADSRFEDLPKEQPEIATVRRLRAQSLSEEKATVNQSAEKCRCGSSQTIEIIHERGMVAIACKKCKKFVRWVIWNGERIAE